MNLGLGLGVGLLGGIGLAFAREGLDSTLRTPEQVEAVAGLPAVGIIPELTRAARGGARRVRWGSSATSSTARTRVGGILPGFEDRAAVLQRRYSSQGDPGDQRLAQGRQDQRQPELRDRARSPGRKSAADRCRPAAAGAAFVSGRSLRARTG